MSTKPLGIAGTIAQKFLLTELTPLLALVGLLLGVFAVLITPREEEPQINVTFANVFIAFPGATAKEVEALVALPAEQVLSEIEGVEHTYSVSRPGMAVLTVQYRVGEDATQAVLRLFAKMDSHADWLPRNLGVAAPVIRPMGIDDVPIMSVTLWTDDQSKGSYELSQVAHTLEAELKRVKGTRDVYTIGGPEQVVSVLLDPQRLAGYGIAIADLRQTLQAANVSQIAGQTVADNTEITVRAGDFMSSAYDIKNLIVGVHNGAAVYLADVATVKHGADELRQSVWFAHGSASGESVTGVNKPAVTIAIAKKPGTNAVVIADRLIEHLQTLKGVLIPHDVQVEVTRNYGETANDKAQTLIMKLVFATIVVIALVFFTLGFREAFIVGSAVVVTLATTLFASWAWGFTLNRVSLFALIFSIGILVDDAIVVVENIHRHLQMGAKNLTEAIPKAVDEVGGPTILATFTVVAALLPMAFVSGLMGPYMEPIPINASMGMAISLAVAFVITPWMCHKFLGTKVHQSDKEGGLNNFFTRLMTPFLRGRQGRWPRNLLFLLMLMLIVGSASLAGFKLVVLKMLPLDNKSEFQIVVDMPEGTPLEQTLRVLDELGHYLSKEVPEVVNYQLYAGTAAPINFNGLVRQYYLREGPVVGDLQVNLVDKSERDRKSHEIALSVREPLQAIGRKYQANVKIVEVPPGPPVMAPLVVEVYGPDYEGQIRVAKKVREVMAATPTIVDIDDSIEAPVPQLTVKLDRHKAALLGVNQQTVVSALATALGGEDVSYLHTGRAKYGVPIRLQLANADKAGLDTVLALKVRAQSGELVPLAELVSIQQDILEKSIYHKDLLPVVFVTADAVGELDSPLYGLFDVFFNIKEMPEAVETVADQYFIDQPGQTYAYSIKWDGEWQITYETFRDMGIAYAAGMILIYLLVVAQFRSYIVPLIIMSPIPLTIIGIMPGHAMLGAQFTATSMIGMIALAGIIVRNSILLVDFIEHQYADGMAFDEAIINATAARTKPIVLTALAAIMGALFILDDPMFSGMAVSLIFGILVSTILTLLVTPVLYYAVMRRRRNA